MHIGAILLIAVIILACQGPAAVLRAVMIERRSRH
jgi:hypothetical protein